MPLLVPYLCCRGAADAISFYSKVFGATEVLRLTDPAGHIGHAELSLGGALLFLSDEFPGWPAESPLNHKHAAVTLSLEVDDVDATAAAAQAVGATIERPPTDEFYGCRSASLRDPFGHRWMISKELEKISPEEMQRRFTELCSGA